jgi:hypothetical protein
LITYLAAIITNTSNTASNNASSVISNAFDPNMTNLILQKLDAMQTEVALLKQSNDEKQAEINALKAAKQSSDVFGDVYIA